MITIEITVPKLVSFKSIMHEIDIRISAKFEKIDNETLNVICEDEDCDILTDYLDLKVYKWRLI